ncbi:hypothetical protein H6798_02110 [Candidatus Nomurabacteria bacterium]|nr:hypothetical protein [Candidatus Nomurabacteria bacterium]
MPAKNTIKNFLPNGYYHIFNKGTGSAKIFKSDQDYIHFLRLLKKHLEKHPKQDEYGRVPVSYHNQIELLAYGLEPKSFSLLVYVGNEPRAISELMRRVCTAYTMYFNHKYNHSGTIFETRYKARFVDDHTSLPNITRHVHRLVDDYKTWPYSSLQYYIGSAKSDWVRPAKIYKMYEWGTYEKYLDSYGSMNHDEAEHMHSQLANY